MPIHLNSDGDDDPPPVDPDTHAYRLLRVLLDHPEMGFSPRELSELTDVPHSSIHKTLSRMRERGLVRKIDSYWAVTDEVAASHLASVVSLDAIEGAYSDDAYGQDDGWADEVPDLGEDQ